MIAVAVGAARGHGVEGAEEWPQGICGCGDDAETRLDGGPDCYVAGRRLVRAGGRKGGGVEERDLRGCVEEVICDSEHPDVRDTYHCGHSGTVTPN